MIEEKRSKPASLLFPLRAYLHGWRLESVVVENQEDIVTILNKQEELPSKVVFTPLFSLGLTQKASQYPEILFVLLGGIPHRRIASEPNLIAITADRLKDMKQAGKMAGLVVQEDNKPLCALFRVGTETREKERDAFMEGYEETAPPGIEPFIETLPASSTRRNSRAFEKAAATAGVLALFAGSANTEALKEVEDLGIPVLTEDQQWSQFRRDQILASVEESPWQRGSALFDVLKIDDIKSLEKEDGGMTFFYPSRMVKGGHPDARRLYRVSKEKKDLTLFPVKSIMQRDGEVSLSRFVK